MRLNLKTLGVVTVVLAMLFVIASCSSSNNEPAAVNNPPVAMTGDDRFVSLGVEAILDGSGSSDPEGQALTYSWSLVSTPANSQSVLSGAGTETPTFTPDVLGDYIVSLVVNDGALDSEADTVTISAADFFAGTSGRTIFMWWLNDTLLEEVDRASIPDEGQFEGNAIFGVARHPSQPWLYTLSLNGPDYSSPTKWWWGDARIDRFAFSADGIEYAGLAFAYNPDTHPSASIAACSSYDWYDGQVGGCAPVNGIFSHDGTRFYVIDDCDDVLHIFEVDELTGDLTLLWEGDTNTYMHGMALHPTESYLYRGSTVFELLPDDTADRLVSGDEGNDTTYVSRDPADGPDLLFSTTDWTNSVGVYSLENPEEPVIIEMLEIGSNQARALAVASSLARMVTVGRNTVTTVAFDGVDLILEDQFEIVMVDPSDPYERIENRSVALSTDDSKALVAWFSRSDENLSNFTGGFTLYEISAAGVLSERYQSYHDRGARVVRKIILP